METHINNINGTSKVFSPQVPKNLGDLGKNLTEIPSSVTDGTLDDLDPEILNVKVFPLDVSSGDTQYGISLNGGGQGGTRIFSTRVEFPGDISSEFTVNSQGVQKFNTYEGVWGEPRIELRKGRGDLSTVTPLIEGDAIGRIQMSDLSRQANQLDIVGKVVYLDGVSATVDMEINMSKAGTTDPRVKLTDYSSSRTKVNTTSLLGVDSNGYIENVNIPEYADDSSAGAAGLVPGNIYHTAGVLKIKL